jgi:hypothetical protein
MSFRDSASFGKRQEFVAIAELLKRNFDVYLTLVDDLQIDCVIRQPNKKRLDYLDIQIKARSKQASKRDAGTFAAMTIRDPRKNFFFIFYSEQAGSYWVMPSLDLMKHANFNKNGKNRGKCRIVFTNYSEKTGEVRPRPKFEGYRDNFDILREFVG